jgi:hypothetical protein
MEQKIHAKGSFMKLGERFLTQKPSHVGAKTRLEERMRSGCPGGFAAKATMMIAVYVRATCRAKVDQEDAAKEAAKEAVSTLLARDVVSFETR